MTPDEKLRTALADAFCSNGQCGGDTSSAPCEHSRVLADIAFSVISNPEHWERVDAADWKKEARNSALEEAAKVAEAKADGLDLMHKSIADYAYGVRATDCRDIAAGIRGLKDSSAK